MRLLHRSRGEIISAVASHGGAGVQQSTCRTSRRCQNLHFLLPVPTPVYTRVRFGMPNSRPMPGVATYFTEYVGATNGCIEQPPDRIDGSTQWAGRRAPLRM